MREMFQQQGRLAAPHIGVVITDGQSSNLTKTKDQFTLAKEEVNYTAVSLNQLLKF